MTERPPKEWRIHAQDNDCSRRISVALGIHDYTARIIVNRGMTSPEEARAFLWPALSQLNDPSKLEDMDVAVARIQKALRDREKILIYGDYDVDGVTSTALLIRFFQELQADVDFYIPDRIDEGYGMNIGSVGGFKASGVKLIISVDNGITAIDEVSEAKRLGMDVIITDHHEPSSRLPDALAVIDAKRSGTAYPFRDLAGVGVAFKVAWAVAQALSGGAKVSPELRAFLIDALGLVALGTVADVVPLTGENRIFVRFGLRSLARSHNPGLKALLAVCNLLGKVPETADLAYKLGPRLNAAGRMGDSGAGVGLLTSTSYPEALTLARFLDGENRRRQAIEQKILDEALGRLGSMTGRMDNVIVLESDDWHVGVLGIVASKIAELYYRPVVLISLKDDSGKGSARSVPEFHIQKALEECGRHLVSFGGHAQAAGLVIERAAVPEFRAALNRHAESVMRGEPGGPSLMIDMELGLADVQGDFVSELDSLRPFGSANQEPMLASRGLHVAGTPRRLGRDGKHLGFFVRDQGVSRRAVAFGFGRLAEEMAGKRVDLAYVPRINTWHGQREIELVVKDVRIP